MARGLLRFLRRNTIAMLALFIALTGTTYAASTALIGKNTVASPQVVNGSLQAKDLSAKARKVLKGSRGPRGLAGAKGATGATGVQGAKGDKGDKGDPGTPATKLWAVVNSDATLVRSSGGVTVGGSGASFYTVTFPQPVDTCAYSATIGRNGGSFSNGGQLEADEFVANGFSPSTVLVRTYNAAGTVTAKRFSLVVFC
jgi:hypothetical protein